MNAIVYFTVMLWLVAVGAANADVITFDEIPAVNDESLGFLDDEYTSVGVSFLNMLGPDGTVYGGEYLVNGTNSNFVGLDGCLTPRWASWGIVFDEEVVGLTIDYGKTNSNPGVLWYAPLDENNAILNIGKIAVDGGNWETLEYSNKAFNSMLFFMWQPATDESPLWTFDNLTYTHANSVPIPASIFLLFAGLMGIVSIRRKGTPK